MAEFKGQAKVSSHSYRMFKGNIYRVTVKADDFEPQVRVQDGNGNLKGSGGNVVAAALPGRTPGGGRGVTQLVFTAPATRDYAIRVDHAPGSEIKQGPHGYTVTIERAAFRPQLSVADAQLEIAEHSRKLEKGKMYSISITGRGFAPEVQILAGARAVATALHGRWFGFGPDAEFVTTLTFAPAKTMEYRIVVCVGPVALGRTAPLTHSAKIAELKTELSVSAQLAKDAPVYPRRGSRHKVHLVKLQAGKKYQIDMISRNFDTYLFLEDSAGTVLMQDDDGGEARNARMIFRPAKTDTYRIVATSYDLAAPEIGPGPYTLTVVENPHAQPKFGMRGGGSASD